MKFSKYLFLLPILAISFNSNSKDLGVNGAVYKIQEPDALEQIYTKLKALEKTGELKRKQQEAVSRAM
ncbi:type-F conjugative transfer system protein TraW, partial [Acinetobacter baumannii]